MAFASAGCGGDDKKAAAAKDTLKFGVTNFAVKNFPPGGEKQTLNRKCFPGRIAKH